MPAAGKQGGQDFYGDTLDVQTANINKDLSVGGTTTHYGPIVAPSVTVVGPNSPYAASPEAVGGAMATGTPAAEGFVPIYGFQPFTTVPAVTAPFRIIEYSVPTGDGSHTDHAYNFGWNGGMQAWQGNNSYPAGQAGEPALYMGMEDHYFDAGPGGFSHAMEWYLRYYSPDHTSVQQFSINFVRVDRTDNTSHSAQHSVGIGTVAGKGYFRIHTDWGSAELSRIDDVLYQVNTQTQFAGNIAFGAQFSPQVISSCAVLLPNTYTVTAVAGQAWGMNSKPNLAASANNDTLVGYEGSFTKFSKGAFTGLVAAGILIDAASFTQVGTGAILNAYGLYVSAPTIGATNYALYVASGSSLLAGPLKISVGAQPFSWTGNTSGIYPGIQTLGGGVGANFSGGNREVNFWNTDTTPPAISFDWRQLNGASAATQLATLSVTGKFSSRDKMYPGTDAAAVQSAAGIYAGTGVPNNANGANGDYYFRSDGSSATTHVYFRSGGTWAGIA